MTDWFETFFEDLWFGKGAGREHEAEFIRRALGLRKGMRVLDAPCGDGQVGIHLARRGVHVTGVDRAPKFIARARRKFRRQGLPGEFQALDLRELDYREQFHAAFNWSGSFGYWSDAENQDIVRRLARALKAGGKLLVDQPNRERILRNFRHHGQRHDTRTTTKWRPDTERVETVWTRRREGRRQLRRSSIRLYTPGQLRRLFERAGLEVIALYGTWLGGEYRRGARRLIIVGRRL